MRSREQLLAVMPGESGDPHSAEVAVARLRDVVGRDVVRTVVKRGYALALAMTPALVAVSHGTSSPDGQAAVAGLVDAVRRRLPGVDVLEAFVDVQEPALETVLDRLGGPAVVVPLLLAPGFHVHVDIARAVSGRAATAAAVLGPDRPVTAILLDRLASRRAARRRRGGARRRRVAATCARIRASTERLRAWP